MNRVAPQIRATKRAAEMDFTEDYAIGKFLDLL